MDRLSEVQQQVLFQTGLPLSDFSFFFFFFLQVPKTLLRPHCTKKCWENKTPCQGECSLSSLLKPLSSGEKKAAFVGGGLSSIEGAKIALSRGVEPVILERSGNLGGIWVSSANSESRIQVDPVSFRPIDDWSPIEEADPSSPFSSIYPTRKEVLARFGKHAEKYSLLSRSVFNVHVEGFEALPNGLARVRMTVVLPIENPTCGCCAATVKEIEKDDEKKHVVCDFKELHIRTGSLTPWHHRSSVSFPGEKTFDKVLVGISDDITVPEMKDKDIVIVGMGAFAVENARRALRGGAKSITILSRKFDKLLFPEIACYLLRSRLQEEDANEDDKLVDMWRDVFKVVQTGACVSGLENAMLNPNCVLTVEGEKHFVFVKGLPSVASNTVLLAHRFGLVDIYEDEVAELQAGEEGGKGVVITKKGRKLQADMLIKCLGFGTEEAMMKGHMVQDSYFVDGLSNITHNLRADRVNGEGVIGPKVATSNFLISYYEDAVEYERSIGHLIESPVCLFFFLKIFYSFLFFLIFSFFFFSFLVPFYFNTQLIPPLPPFRKPLKSFKKWNQKRTLELFPQSIILQP